MKLSRVCHFAGQVLHKPRTFSGIQPTGTVHLGNYFGAVQKWVNELKSAKTEDHDRIFSVVDLHAITMPQKPKELRENILTMTASLLGCGLDSKKAILFQQSHVDEHAQLCWILELWAPWTPSKGCLNTRTNRREWRRLLWDYFYTPFCKRPIY